jgi:hypothetical protein
LDREDIAGSLGTDATSVSILGHRRIQLHQATVRLRNLHTDTGTIKKTMRILAHK